MAKWTPVEIWAPDPKRFPGVEYRIMDAPVNVRIEFREGAVVTYARDIDNRSQAMGWVEADWAWRQKTIGGGR